MFENNKQRRRREPKNASARTVEAQAAARRLLPRQTNRARWQPPHNTGQPDRKRLITRSWRGPEKKNLLRALQYSALRLFYYYYYYCTIRRPSSPREFPLAKPTPGSMARREERRALLPRASSAKIFTRISLPSALICSSYCVPIFHFHSRAAAADPYRVTARCHRFDVACLQHAFFFFSRSLPTKTTSGIQCLAAFRGLFFTYFLDIPGQKERERELKIRGEKEV